MARERGRVPGNLLDADAHRAETDGAIGEGVGDINVEGTHAIARGAREWEREDDMGGEGGGARRGRGGAPGAENLSAGGVDGGDRIVVLAVLNT